MNELIKLINKKIREWKKWAKKSGCGIQTILLKDLEDIKVMGESLCTGEDK